MQEKKSHDWVRGIDSIRFVLALIVFLSHLDNQVATFLKGLGNGFTYYTGVAYNHIFLGPGAVVAFFIISGFVIHYPLKGKQLNVKQFLVRRWVRVGLPLLVAVAIAVSWRGIWMIPVWSLYCELIYYTLYPILRRVPVSWNVQFIISFIVAAILIFTLADDELTSMLTQTSVNYSGSYALLGDLITWLIGLPCWLIGVIIAEHIDNLSWNISRIRIYFLRGVMLCFAALLVALKAHWFVSYLFTLNFFAPLVGFWITAEIIYFRNHEPSRWLEYGGKFSYSLYLLHGMVHMVAYYFFEINLYTYVPIILITIFISWIFYLVVENPSHKLSRYLASRV